MRLNHTLIKRFFPLCRSAFVLTVGLVDNIEKLGEEEEGGDVERKSV